MDKVDDTSISTRQGAPPTDDLSLGDNAPSWPHRRATSIWTGTSETTVKGTPLADYRVVYFAKVAGEIRDWLRRSSLTLPKQPTDMDDGLLTASEVAQLKVNADWVVLSA